MQNYGVPIISLLHYSWQNFHYSWFLIIFAAKGEKKWTT